MRSRLCLFWFISLGCCVNSIAATGESVPLSLRHMGVEATVPVTPMTRQRFTGIAHQQKDYSCGAAALSTLLTHHYGDPVSEMEILDQLMTTAAQSRLTSQGLSMLDMKQFLEKRGYVADGYRIPVVTLLQQTGVPLIALVDAKGYRHFVVVKGLRNNTLLIGDPARGLRRMRLEAFENSASGALLLVKSHARQGRRHFNDEKAWASAPAAPLNSPLVRPDGVASPLDALTRSPF